MWQDAPPQNRLHAFGQIAVTLILLGPALLFFSWLALTCAEFLNITLPTARGGMGTYFALYVSCGVLVPPALMAALNNRNEGYPFGLRLREAGRAAFMAFLAFAILFFALSRMFVHFFPGARAALLPFFLYLFSPALTALLLYLSYRLMIAMVPLPAQTDPAPALMTLFAALAWLQVLALPIRALAPSAPFGLPALSHTLYPIRLLPLHLFLASFLPHLLLRRGARIFRPAYLVFCLLVPMLALSDMRSLPWPWLAFHISLALAAVAACACLYATPVRKWLK